MGANVVTGITTTVVNFNVNLSTGDGSAWGTLETTQDDGGCGGTFTATLTGTTDGDGVACRILADCGIDVAAVAVAARSRFA